MSAPPAFVFAGDTFAVPSWEFACELPPVHPPGTMPPPATRTSLFGVQWRIYRAYRYGTPHPGGLILLSPDGQGLVLSDTGRGCPASEAEYPPGSTRRVTPERTYRPDEFMQALRAIAERNEQ